MWGRSTAAGPGLLQATDALMTSSAVCTRNMEANMWAKPGEKWLMWQDNSKTSTSGKIKA